MATKLKGGGAPKKKAAKPKDAPSVGHNLTEIKKKIVPFFTRVDKVHMDMETRAGEFRSDIKALYEEAANQTGVPRKLIAKLYRRHRKLKNWAAEDAELEASELEAQEMIEAGLEGTPFAAYLGQLDLLGAERKAAAKA
ncbi:MAG: hypothetical protein GC190_19195 [Alphaproteobacteria bacterium]|nr:hypothetical protein [Alphaproteobacteria bacterium]